MSEAVKKDEADRFNAGERVVIGFAALNAVLGGLPFVTGPVLAVSDYTMFVAVKRAMRADFQFRDVFSLVAPTIKGTFALAMFKAVVDALGWSWAVTIPVGALVSAATTYALGMVFVTFNLRGGSMSEAEALGLVTEGVFTYLDKVKAKPEHVAKARVALKKMLDRKSRHTSSPAPHDEGHEGDGDGSR